MVTKYQNAVDIIKTAILQSQARAAKAVNQEQLALYYGIGRYVSANSRKRNWGKGAIETISEQLRKELPGLRGFSATSMRNIRTFYEEWRQLESNSSVATDENVRQTNNLSDKLSDKQVLKDKIKAELSDKTKISDKLSDIVVWTASKEFVSTNMVVSQFGIDERNARRYLTRLVDLKFLSAEGENKNKKYRYRK